MAADLARVGIRAKLVELEFGTYIRNWREKKFRGLARPILPIWFGEKQPASSLESIHFFRTSLDLSCDTGD